MLLQPTRANSGRTRKALAVPRPAPTGGWNARDAIDDMDPTDAQQLDNWFPGTDSISLRPGSARWATGLGDEPVESVIAYASGSTSKLLGCCDGSIFDCTSEGAVGTALATGKTSNRWQHVNFKSYALLFNGADTPQKYDGSTIADNTITGSGLTATNLIYPWIFKERVFLIEKNTLNAWYLATAAIAGAATKIDLSSVATKGGYLVAGGTWTRDGGSGMDDLCVFLTNKGEVLIYQGTDPSSSSTWAKVGNFYVGPPVGQRPIFNMTADLIIVSIDGFIPLSRALPVDRVGSERIAISDKIRDAVNDATRLYKGNFGWQAIHYPNGNWGLFNVPIVEGLTSHQYVMNTITGAWCRFIGLNAACWEVFEDNLYFGGMNGVVYRADSGIGDDTGEGVTVARASTTADVVTAYDYMGMRGSQKRFTQVRPLLASDGVPSIELAFNVDFSDRAPAAITSSDSGGASWDEVEWDMADWASDRVIQRNWYSIGGYGYCGSLHLRVATNALEISLNSINYQFEPGGLM